MKRRGFLKRVFGGVVAVRVLPADGVTLLPPTVQPLVLRDLNLRPATPLDYMAHVSQQSETSISFSFARLEEHQVRMRRDVGDY